MYLLLRERDNFLFFLSIFILNINISIKKN